jgi:hypothetical protein
LTLDHVPVVDQSRRSFPTAERAASRINWPLASASMRVAAATIVVIRMLAGVGLSTSVMPSTAPSAAMCSATVR